MTTLHLTPAGTIHRLLDTCAYRLGQAAAFARPQSRPEMPTEIALCLRPGTVERFRQLPAADQRHLLAVGASLRETGASQDLWIAGLLHDIGKCHRGRHVHLLDRGVWVFSSHIRPLARRIRELPDMPRAGSGLWIAAHHAALGATTLRELGYSERICTLVAAHEDAVLAQTDPELASLRLADDARHSVPATVTTQPSARLRKDAHGHAG
ncbi:MAG: HD domain-containing protein [Thermomicrobiales bacterium]